MTKTRGSTVQPRKSHARSIQASARAASQPGTGATDVRLYRGRCYFQTLLRSDDDAPRLCFCTLERQTAASPRYTQIGACSAGPQALPRVDAHARRHAECAPVLQATCASFKNDLQQSRCPAGRKASASSCTPSADPCVEPMPYSQPRRALLSQCEPVSTHRQYDPTRWSGTGEAAVPSVECLIYVVDYQAGIMAVDVVMPRLALL